MVFCNFNWEIVRFLLGDGPFVCIVLDLIEQDVAGPTELGNRTEVVQPRGGVLDFLEQFDVMAPGDSRQEFSYF